MVKRERAFAFPGQGSQGPEMGQELAATSDRARRTFEDISSIIGEDILGLCANEAALRSDTRVIQLAVFSVSAAALVSLREEKRIDADYFVGHSQGEVTAFYAADMYDLETAVGIVRERGASMYQAGRDNEGGMFVASSRPIDECEEIARTTGAELANVNSTVEGKEQVVFSGRAEEIDAVSSHFDPDDRRSFRLPIPVAAHHSEIMLQAGISMQAHVESVQHGFRDPRPVLPNYITRGQADVLIRDEIRGAEQLWAQLTRGVNYAEDTRFMFEELGVKEVVEVGPSMVLTGLHSRFVKSRPDLRGTIKTLAFGDKTHIDV